MRLALQNLTAAIRYVRRRPSAATRPHRRSTDALTPSPDGICEECAQPWPCAAAPAPPRIRIATEAEWARYAAAGYPDDWRSA